MKNTLNLLVLLLLLSACKQEPTVLQEEEAEVATVITKPTEDQTELIKKTYEKIPIKENFELNESFHVMALSGLRMRATPDLKGETVLTIPYDAAVEEVDEGDYGTLEVEEIKDFIIKGNWRKVRYDGKEGYVFDGFLTKFPLPNEVIKFDEVYYNNYENLFDCYLKTKIGKASERYDFEKYRDCEVSEIDDCVCAYKQDFDEVAQHNTTGCSEVGQDYGMILKGISLTEAYFIIKAMDLNAVNTVSADDTENLETVTYNKERQIISLEANGAGCYTTIRQISINKISIETSCGC